MLVRKTDKTLWDTHIVVDDNEQDVTIPSGTIIYSGENFELVNDIVAKVEKRNSTNYDNQRSCQHKADYGMCYFYVHCKHPNAINEFLPEQADDVVKSIVGTLYGVR